MKQEYKKEIAIGNMAKELDINTINNVLRVVNTMICSVGVTDQTIHEKGYDARLDFTTLKFSYDALHGVLKTSVLSHDKDYMKLIRHLRVSSDSTLTDVEKREKIVRISSE
jgi:hypothetical protein